MTLLHGTTVALNGDAVLIMGQSGAGKSSAALALIHHFSAVLVSDDYTVVNVHEKQAFASPPLVTKGLIEIRSIGIVRLPFMENSKLCGVIRLKPLENNERLPDVELHMIDGVQLPCITLPENHPDNPLRIFYAVNVWRGDIALIH